MRGYGFPEKDPWTHSIKEPDGPRTPKGRNWLKRYTHKCARQIGKEQLLSEAQGTILTSRKDSL
jgi:hypothetical protein